MSVCHSVTHAGLNAAPQSQSLQLSRCERSRVQMYVQAYAKWMQRGRKSVHYGQRAVHQLPPLLGPIRHWRHRPARRRQRHPQRPVRRGSAAAPRVLLPLRQLCPRGVSRSRQRRGHVRSDADCSGRRSAGGAHGGQGGPVITRRGDEDDAVAVDHLGDEGGEAAAAGRVETDRVDGQGEMDGCGHTQKMMSGCGGSGRLSRHSAQGRAVQGGAARLVFAVWGSRRCPALVGRRRRLAIAHVHHLSARPQRGDDRPREARPRLHASEAGVPDLARNDLRSRSYPVQARVLRVVRRHDTRHVGAVRARVDHDREHAPAVVDVCGEVARVGGAQRAVLVLERKIREGLEELERAGRRAALWVQSGCRVGAEWVQSGAEQRGEE